MRWGKSRPQLAWYLWQEKWASRFAWLPVRTFHGKWVWLEQVEYTMQWQPLGRGLVRTFYVYR